MSQLKCCSMLVERGLNWKIWTLPFIYSSLYPTWFTFLLLSVTCELPWHCWNVEFVFPLKFLCNLTTISVAKFQGNVPTRAWQVVSPHTDTLQLTESWRWGATVKRSRALKMTPPRVIIFIWHKPHDALVWISFTLVVLISFKRM